MSYQDDPMEQARPLSAQDEDGHINSVEAGKGTGRSPCSYSTDAIQWNTLQGSPKGISQGEPGSP